MEIQEYTVEYIRELLAGTGYIAVLVRITIAALFGAIIGIDRGRKRRPAGLRTYMLVCIGSALVMITGQRIAEIYGTVDPARLGAQVISGIGFLGAGTIIVTRHNQVIGLTTAAGLWASACFGLAIGIGFYTGALVAGSFILLTVVVLHNLDERFVARSKLVEIYAEFDSIESFKTFIGYVKEQTLKISDIQLVKARETLEPSLAALFTVRSPVQREHAEILEVLSSAKGMLYMEEVT